MTRDWPPDLAAPGSLLGQLQRGLGSAAVRVLGGDVADAAPMVLGCIAADPRWDRQLDSRRDYYAWLVPVAGVEIDALVELVRADEAEAGDVDRGSALALDVLLRLAVHGSAPALAASHDYVARGRYWVEAVHHLASEGVAVDGLDEVICRRWPTVEALGEEIAGHGLARRRIPPWDEWAERQPLIAAALDFEHERIETYVAPVRERIRGRPTEELLAIDDVGYLSQVGQKLVRRTTEADLRAMLATVQDRAAPMRPAAARALAIRGRVEALPAALELDESTRPRIARAMLTQAFEALPYEHTRDVALEWLTGPDGARRRAAGLALAAHANAEDVPRVRALLQAELDAELEGDQYRVCDLATALGRHPDLGPFAELQRAYREMPYSFGRRFVVEAIAATDPAFPHTLAAECARDAEPDVRAIAGR